MTLLRQIAVVIATAITYFVFCRANSFLFSSMGYANGVDWVFLPSGLRLVFILIFVEAGALGIALGSCALAFLYQVDGSAMTYVVTGAISGFPPMLARRICIDMLNLDVNLRGLTPRGLLQTAALFALTSSLLHQLWYTWCGQTNNFVGSSIAMAVGDFSGTMLILYAAKALLNVLRSIGTSGR